MNHPPAFKLDALAAGDQDATTRAHLATCEACSAYVKKLDGEAAAFRATSDPAAFAEAVATRARRPTLLRSLGRGAWYAAPTLAVAAAIALWVGRSNPGVPGTVTDVVGPMAEAHLHFKGGMSVVAVRERGGVQERLSGPFEVAPNDRVRVEVAVDHDEPVVAGLLSGDGTWTPLLAPAELTAGTHFSELAARFDDKPTDALLLVGAPDDVARARATRTFDGIVAWRIRSEPGP
jgi:hypothetical protein